jgi:hypothetical protein
VPGDQALSSPQRRRDLAFRAVVALTVAAVAAGCSGAAKVDPPNPPPEGSAKATACGEFMARLPDELADESRRETEPASDFTAAWGRPAISVRCGVSDPAALNPASELTVVGDVEWFAEELTEGYAFTTYERVANVEVTVPDDYAPEIGPVSELSSLVAEFVPTR